MIASPEGRECARSARSFAAGLTVLLIAILGVLGSASAADIPFNTRDPVFGAACQTCVWGGLAEWEHRPPPALTKWNVSHGQARRINDPVDFGVTQFNLAQWTAFFARADQATQFDVILSDNAAWANSGESRFWPAVTLKYRRAIIARLATSSKLQMLPYVPGRSPKGNPRVKSS